MALRVILDDCRPALFALGVALLALIVVIRISGCRLDLRRLAHLHRCERGGVQSLSFVLTLPVFVMIVMFVVQVSQLMIAQVVVNYAAYGAARSLSAWVPQHVVETDDQGHSTDLFGRDHLQNVIPDNRLSPSQSVGYYYVGGSRQDGFVGGVGGQTTENIAKLEFPFRSDVAACATISPSRQLGLNLTTDARDHFLATRTAWQQFIGPAATASNNGRLYSKYSYSYWNTELWIRFQNLDSNIGPTHNPLNCPAHSHRSNEIGWRDPITITVRHNLALLPGPGRFLAKHLVRPGGPPDMVSHRISQWAGPRRQINANTAAGSAGSAHDPQYNRRVYATTVWARATVTNDGIKSLVPYVHTRQTQ